MATVQALPPEANTKSLNIVLPIPLAAPLVAASDIEDSATGNTRDSGTPSPTTPTFQTLNDVGKRDFAEWQERPFTLASQSRRMSLIPARAPPEKGANVTASAPRRSIAFPKSSSSEELAKQLEKVTMAVREHEKAQLESLDLDEVLPEQTTETSDPAVTAPIPLRTKSDPPVLPPPIRTTALANPLPIPLAAPLVPAADLPSSSAAAILPPLVIPSTPVRTSAPRLVKEKDDKEVIYGPDQVGNFDLGPVVGSGTFAKVRLAQHTYTHQAAVCKMITFPEPIDPRDRLHFFALREAAVLMSLPPMPNITTLFEFHRADSHVELVMTLAPGVELFGYCQTFPKGVPEPTARHVVTQLLAALDHLHTHSVLHRDCKLDNVFYDPVSGQVTLIDFGLATFYHPSVRMTEVLGTASYASPSLLTLLEDGFGSMLPQKGHMDLWALGVLTHGLSTHRFPFEETEPGRLLREIFAKKAMARPFTLPEEWEAGARDRAEDFLKTVLDPANEGKITARSLLGHPWIRGPDSESAPRVPISKPTPSFITPTRELADATNYTRNFSELARLVTAKVQSRSMRLAIPFGGGNLGSAPGSALVPNRPDSAITGRSSSAASSRPETPGSGNRVSPSPRIEPARPTSRLSMLSSLLDEDERMSDSDGSGPQPHREKKSGGFKKLFGKIVDSFH